MLLSDLLDRCSAHELQEWSAYLSLKPEDLVPEEGIESKFERALGVRRG